MVVFNDHRHPKNAELTTKWVVNIVFFETLTTKKFTTTDCENEQKLA